MASGFHTTQWSLILAAQGTDTAQAREALAELCEAYWQPLYVFVRRQGHGADEARDLTQAFFAHILETDFLQTVTPDAGRFRSFLLASLRNLLSDERRRQKALKRGRGATPLSLDIASAERVFPVQSADDRTPEVLFEKRWARTILERALDRMRDEFTAQGKLERFEALKPFLAPGGRAPQQREVAERLGMNEAAVATAIHRLRRRYGEALREEVGRTVASPDEVEDEIRHLLRVLA